MKNDNDFLNGVYHKAEALRKIDSRKTSWDFKSNHKWFIVAATMILVISLNMYFTNSETMVIKRDNTDQTPNVSRFKNFTDISYIAHEADLIVSAKVKKISKSLYENDNITTNVDLSLKEIYKGSVEGKSIEIVVSGGFDKKTKTYVEYESIFEPNENVLLFLNKIDNKYYLTCSSHGKYTYINNSGEESSYKGSNGEILTLLQLKELIEKEK